MKTAMSALDLHFMLKELSFIKDSKIMKIFEHDVHKELFCFQLHAPGKGKILLNLILPSLLYMAEQKFVFPKIPPGFCAFLRKYLSNARIREIRQVGFERILEFVIETLDSKFILIVELFSTGNVILCHEDYKIKGLLYSQKWDARTIRGGIKYEYPPGKVNLLTLTKDELSKMILSTDSDSLVKFCATELSLGGFYAEYLVTILGVDKHSLPKDVNIDLFYDSLRSLINSNIEPCIKNNEISPIAIEGWMGGIDSFSSGIDNIYADKFEKEAFVAEQKQHNTIVSKYEKRLSEQQMQIDNCEKEISINSARGDLIYSHYQEISTILADIKEMRKNGSWDDIKEKYKNHAIVKKIDEHSGNISLELN